MKDVNKICTVVAICFFLWQLNNIFQLSYKRIKLDECVQEANVNYEKNWDNACKIAGKKPNCTLFCISIANSRRNKKT